MVGGAIVFATLYKGGAAPAGGNGNNGNAAVATSTTNPAQAMTLGPRDAILGNTNAKVTLVEYGDYQCPYCVEFFSQTQPQIIQNYVNTGKVKVVFRDFAFLGTESTAAANASQCAEDQGKLWAYHDALYGAKLGDEAKGGTENDGFYSRTEFLKLAAQIKLDVPSFTTCIDTNKYATLVTQEKGDATKNGVNSTPNFFINGQQEIGANPFANFQQVIDTMLSAK